MQHRCCMRCRCNIDRGLLHVAEDRGVCDTVATRQLSGALPAVMQSADLFDIGVCERPSCSHSLHAGGPQASAHSLNVHAARESNLFLRRPVAVCNHDVQQFSESLHFALVVERDIFTPLSSGRPDAIRRSPPERSGTGRLTRTPLSA